ncbi:MAG: dethiobiotin synthase [Candidatus Sumerlaeaceae bacterium]|nr:dethiobiotin synthase [Candidatus Sumerlaeaceae bacterium]
MGRTARGRDAVVTTQRTKTTGLFVTGTDTGVGKTVVAATLARALRLAGHDVGVMKCVATGVGWPGEPELTDAELLATAAQSGDPLDLVCPQRFRPPLAPLTAARLDGRHVNVEAIANAASALAQRHRWLIVEGVGGAAVPITADLLVSDLAARLGLPALIVARTALGTVNHTVLTVEHLRERKVQVAGVVFVRGADGALSLAEEHGPPLACQTAGVCNFGIFPYVPGLAGHSGHAESAADLLPCDAPCIRAVADWLTRPE